MASVWEKCQDSIIATSFQCQWCDGRNHCANDQLYIEPGNSDVVCQKCLEDMEYDSEQYGDDTEGLTREERNA